MIRRIQLNINHSNIGKLKSLNCMMDESLRVLNSFISRLWNARRFTGKFTNLKDEETWLSARLQQALGKQALETVKSQKKRHKKTMPVIRKPTLNLDSRFLSFRQDTNSFDFWVHMGSVGNRITLNLPSKKHSHFNKYLEDGWELKRSGRLRKTAKGWFLDVYVEKEEPSKRKEGKAVGLDCGYKKLIVCSDGQAEGLDMEQTYEKIARKKQGSLSFKKALKERDNKINECVNKLDLSDVQTLCIEGLKNVKKGSKGKIFKKFNSKLQRWSYPKVSGKLAHICELSGIRLIIVNPAYTSQKCSCCGHVDSKSRSREKFECTRCGMKEDADFNASKNILMRGIYSSSPVQAIP